MDIAVVQTKEGSSLQFLPVILLEREEGRGWVGGIWGGSWRLGPVAVPQKAHAASSLIQQARRRQPLHGSPVSLALRPQEETFGKTTAPSPKRGKTMCLYCERGAMCTPICASRMQHFSCSITRDLSSRAKSEIPKMAGVQRYSEEQSVMLG